MQTAIYLKSMLKIIAIEYKYDYFIKRRLTAFLFQIH